MLNNKKILIIGGTGSLGKTLTERYIKTNDIIIYSRGENNQWAMKCDFNNNPNLTFFVGDIRDKERLETCIFRFKPDIVIIAAALKHIDICEKNINECINTNIDGIRNVINIITQHSMNNTIPFLETVLFISTDKACAPVNTYGMCKAVSERIVVEKTEFLKCPKFVIVRYGNVLMSRGSLIPTLNDISKDPKKLYYTITDTDMTRYFMTLDMSVELIDYAINHGENGDTVIPKHITSYKIIDIIQKYSEKYNKPIKNTGIRPGEKIHETLISFTESLRTVEKDDYYVIKPSYSTIENYVKFEHEEFNSLVSVKELDELILDCIN